MKIIFTFLLGLAGGLAALQLQAQSITQLSFFSPLISSFEGKYSNNRLLVSQQGLKVFDVSDPTQTPMLVSTVPYPGNYAYQLATYGKRVYMSHGNNGMLGVYEFTSIGGVAYLGSISIPSPSFLTVGDLVARGNHVYVGSSDFVYVVDVSNGLAPQLVTAFSVPGTNSFTSISGMAVDGNTLYVVTSTLNAFDVSNPASPALLSSVPGEHFLKKGLAADTIGHRLFSTWVANSQQFTGHDTYDYSNPAAPQHLFSDSTTFGAGGEFGASVYANNVLLTSKGGVVVAYDVTQTGHTFKDYFSGQDVPNSSVSITVKDSVFFNVRRGGIEVLHYPMQIQPTGIPEELKSGDGFVLFPNPGLNPTLCLTTGQRVQEAEIAVLDATGREIYKIQNANFSNGQYYLSLQEKVRSGLYMVIVKGKNVRFARHLLVE